MPQGIRTPGPILLYARLRSVTTAYYMGTCVLAPQNKSEKFKIPVMNDLGGRSVPFQLVQDGELWYVLCTMNRFDYNLIQSLRALESGIPVNAGTGNLSVGGETGLARGSLNIGITDWELIAINSYYGTGSAGQYVGGLVVADMIAGRRFYSCNIRTYQEDTEGERVLSVSMAIECQNIFQAGQTIPTRGFNLFTEDINSLGPLGPIS